MEKRFLRQYESFYKKAVTDLRSAKNLLRDFDAGEVELDLDVVFFHLQQAAEKLIKTLLDFNKIKFPHTHDLQQLLNILNDRNIKAIDKVGELLPLSGFAVEGRYGTVHDDMEDANKHIALLDEFIKFVEKSIAV